MGFIARNATISSLMFSPLMGLFIRFKNLPTCLCLMSCSTNCPRSERSPMHIKCVQEVGCRDDRLAPGEWGPFDNHAALGEFLGFEAAYIPRTLSPCTRNVIHSTQTIVTYRTVTFAHGDLASPNIHWKNGRIVDI